MMEHLFKEIPTLALRYRLVYYLVNLILLSDKKYSSKNNFLKKYKSTDF